MQVQSFSRTLGAACVLALGSLGLMSWSLLDPRPLTVVVAMSVGQVLGTISLLTFVAVVIADLRRARFASDQLGVTLASSASNPARAESTVADGPTSLKK
jgi:putative effector of murein hydrolase